MDPSGRAYEDFVPPHRLVREPAAHTLSVDLSAAGYKKEHIRVQMVHSHRRLIVRGERPVAGNRWSRFRLEFRVPDDCDAKAVHARFEKGVVRVALPGLAPPDLVVAAGAGAQQQPSPPADITAAPDVVGAARGAAGGGEEAKNETAAAPNQEAGQQQRVASAKDAGGHDEAGEGRDATADSPSRRGYAFVQGRRKQLATTAVGVVLVMVGLGIYVKYSLWP